MLPISFPEILLGARQGHTEPVSALYQHYHPAIFRYLYYRVGDQQTAEDLTAEVFLRMVRSLGEFRAQGVPFHAWLFRIARNLAVDHFRRTHTQSAVELPESHPDGATTEHLVELTLTSERLQQALTQLNEEQREVVTLRFILGMSLVETAQAIHRSEDAVKGLQRRGLMALREQLKDLEVCDD